MSNYANEDVGNIVALEHVNVQVPDQAVAVLFYIVGLGLTRDPYLTVGLENMWVNLGEQQFHLPTRKAQVIQGHIGVVLPDLDHVQCSLEGIASRLQGTRFAWSRKKSYLSITCPWGNHFRCHVPSSSFSEMAIGMPYVEFLVRPGSARPIALFYEQVFGAFSKVRIERGTKIARVEIGRNQALVFRETAQKLLPYDGHHIAIYVANFSQPYEFLMKRGLIREEVANHQFRFTEIVDPRSGSGVFQLEHEVRSLRHPMYHRLFINRDPRQTQRHYRRGRDAFVPFV